MTLLRTILEGWPTQFEMGRVLPAGPDTIWRLITDWENQGDWMLEATDLVVTSEQREGVGVEAEATISIAGIKTRDRIRVTTWEPGKHLVMAHLGWVRGEGEIVLTDLGDRGTHLFWREMHYPPLGIAGAIGLSLLKPLMKRIFERDLRILESLARAASSPAAPRVSD